MVVFGVHYRGEQHIAKQASRASVHLNIKADKEASTLDIKSYTVQLCRGWPDNIDDTNKPEST